MGGDDDLAEYGTPLEPLDEDNIVGKKPLLQEEQVVRDENGRRRFHGAFTGGFSAGFYNTVGSLEGWRPSEFKSSRSERAQSKAQKPQDFMDREDFGQFGIAPTILQANEDYAKSGVNKRRHVEGWSEGPIPGTPVLSQLLRPVRETVGAILLKNMGWKPGQGVGPRLTKVEKDKQKKKVYGCAMPGLAPEEDDEDEDGLNLDEITFAPNDWQPFVCSPKDNVFGLGYVGLDRTSVLGSLKVSSGLQLQEKNRKVNIRGQAFGVGAFEEDDDDIYMVEDMRQYDRSLSAAVEEVEQAPPPRPAEVGVLEGFVRAKGPGLVRRSFPPPKLPREYVPKAPTRRTRFDVGPEAVAPPQRKDLGRHNLTSGVRSILIGEATPEDIVARTQKEARAITEGMISSVQLQTSGYRPFALDADKQRRYEQFLKLLQLGEKQRLESLQPVTMTEWERGREKVEFEQAAKLFRPLTGVMSDRFTRGSQPDDVNNPLAAVEKTTHANIDMHNAAKAKMFGKLTRTEEEWQPCSLLCKRFNIPEPNVSVAVKTKKPSSYSIFDCLESMKLKQEPESDAETESVTEPQVAMEAPPPEVRTLVLPQPTDQAFIEPEDKVDLFKAIFLDSEDEEEKPPTPEPQQNTQRNTSPARGLFENVDLESLQLRARPKTPEPEVTPPEIKETPESQPAASQVEDPALYGPKLPDNLKGNTPAPAQREPRSSSSSPELWVEKRSKKPKKKSKKHKEDKHRSKHKRKKHKR